MKSLELTAPGACRTDRHGLHRKVQKGEIFGGFDAEAHDAIWREILSVSTNRLIPSLYSFLEDTNYPQGSAHCMRRLIKPIPNDTLASAMEECFTDRQQRQDQCLIQITESTTVFRPRTMVERFDLGRRQFWMAAMRNYLEVPAQHKREKGDLPAKPSSKPDMTTLYEIANFAYHLGFESEYI